ncbi:hypothetical protein [Pontibacter sp. G13]|uniref:hypothetical protein n=1 Tax=Pontibacter sp. G13 TaxID=3074898 RepID=UPI002889E5AE|nr:hypothetical protein [Pontibacter sp. G13]WNJ19226.1 hypothetical protein RJD25_01935 [Pontibacter sp. G13]
MPQKRPSRIQLSSRHVQSVSVREKITHLTKAISIVAFAVFGVQTYQYEMPEDFVDLRNLQATQLQTGWVNLHWNTQSEQDTDFFIVERSSDGIHYERVGTLAAAGYSELPLKYEYVDNTPRTGVSHYRISVVNLSAVAHPIDEVMVLVEFPQISGKHPAPLGQNQPLIP